MGVGASLVLGGAGFVGSHLVDALLASGEHVTAVDNLSTGSMDNLALARNENTFRFIAGDICEDLNLPTDIGTIYNLASPASPSAYMSRPVDTLRAGSIGVLKTLELARQIGATYFYASTSEVYGDPEVSPQHEDYWGNVNPIGPRSVYDEAKRFGEAAVSTYTRVHGVHGRIGRLFNTYGPRMGANDGRLVPNLITQMLSSEPMTIYGTGSQTRSLCYVDDTVEAIRIVAASPLSSPVNIGSSDERTVTEIATVIARLGGLPNAVLAHLPVLDDDPQQRRPDLTKISRISNWSPKVGLEDGLLRTIDWFSRTCR
ncbi:NAD-dependent epimerase/dehydratase family protein [Promicromonospora sp. MS192]|uniref:NAD-dependent epimerase/dehydratase family protein n=1 Tax=Promicromonospora sp. MS192 TaxID=3412684 RepID=UPI003C3099C4